MAFEARGELHECSKVPVCCFRQVKFHAEMSLHLRANNFITELFEPRELVKKVNEVLNHHESG